jgi:ABC-type transport system involved in multi-copper enzyme maturation permease subunit
VKALVHAELLKLRSTRTTTGLLLATLAMVGLTVAFTVKDAGDQNAPLPLDDAGLLAGTVGISFGVPQVLVVLLGCMAFSQEFRYGTITSTYLVEPRRTRVLAAKWLSVGLASVVIATTTLALSVPFGIALIRSRNGDATVAAQFWQMVAAAFVVMVAYGAIGVAVGALVRNQIVAVVGVLVWMLAVEQIVINSFPAVGRWMPIGAAFALLQLGPAISLDGKLLSSSIGGLVLLGYTAAAVALALHITPSRDVL